MNCDAIFENPATEQDRESKSSSMKVIAAICALALAAPVGWYVYTSIRQKYWDDQARAICERPDSIQIFSKVPLSESEYQVMPRVAGHLAGFAPLELTGNLVPTYVRTRKELLRKDSPEVWITNSEVIRRADGAVVARFREVTRLGGDPIAIDHPSSFVCPTLTSIYEKLKAVYVREGAK